MSASEELVASPAGPHDADYYEEAPIVAKTHSRGWAGALVVYGPSAVIGAGMAMRLAYTYLCNPSAFFSLKDRSHLDSQEPLPDIKHEYLEANGIRIHAVSLGRQPHKPLMLFLHGFPEFWYSWRHQLRHYSRDYDAVAIDMRGYGLSDKPPDVDSYRLDVLAADVAAVIKALGHERCVLVADDWGTVVAWVVAGAYSEMVERLVAMAGPHPALGIVNMTMRQLVRSWYVFFMQVPYLPELYFTNNDLETINQLYTPGTMWGPRSGTAVTDSDREWYKWTFAKPGAATASINYYRAYMRHMTYAPMPQVWRALKRRMPMPVLVIMGAQDTALGPELVNHMDQVAPLSEVHVLEGCSHWVACEQPLKVIELMDKFMDKYPPKVLLHKKH